MVNPTHEEIQAEFARLLPGWAGPVVEMNAQNRPWRYTLTRATVTIIFFIPTAYSLPGRPGGYRWEVRTHPRTSLGSAKIAESTGVWSWEAAPLSEMVRFIRDRILNYRSQLALQVIDLEMATPPEPTPKP